MKPSTADLCIGIDLILLQRFPAASLSLAFSWQALDRSYHTGLIAWTFLFKMEAGCKWKAKVKFVFEYDRWVFFFLCVCINIFLLFISSIVINIIFLKKRRKAEALNVFRLKTLQGTYR